MKGEDVRERARDLTKELAGNPFFPLLFIGEAVKNASFHALAGTPELDVVAASSGLAVASVVGWLYSYDEVAWGLQKAQEAVEEATEDG